MFFAPGMFAAGSQRDMASMLLEPRAPVMTQSMHLLAKELPDAEAPTNREPVYQKELPGLTLAAVQERLDAEPFVFERVIRQQVQASGFTPSSWQEGVRVLGTKIRGTKFQMPMPADIPSAARRLIAIPETAQVRIMFRMRCQQNRVDIVQQALTEGVPLGENFRVQTTHSFVSHGGGIILSKWIELIWIKELPRLMGGLRSFIESKTQTDAKKEADVLVEVLLDECKR